MEKIISVNPATEEVLAEFEVSTEAEILDMVNKAKTAFSSWKKVPYKEKVKILENIRKEVHKKRKFLAELITKEMGKPLRESEAEIISSLCRIDFFIKNIKKYLEPERINKNTTLFYEPVGTVAIITPWNYPVSIPFKSFIPCILIGNPIIFKPGELTPTISMEIVKIFNNHLPQDVLQTAIGADDIGKLLVKSDISMVSFTGSIETGRNIMADSSEKLHKLVMEMGGKDPAIVLEDADLNLTAKALIKGAFENCGQICHSVERVYVPWSISDKFIDKIVKEGKKLKVGNGLNKNTDIGPLASDDQLYKVESRISGAVKKGARIILGGKIMKRKGFYMEPTLLTNVDSSMKIMTEETFGPVLPIQFISGETREAIFLANSLNYGLTASVWTTDPKKGQEIAEKLEAGTVGINQLPLPQNDAPWGGIKKSGIGKSLSKYGVREFCNMKVIRK